MNKRECLEKCAKVEIYLRINPTLKYKLVHTLTFRLEHGVRVHQFFVNMLTEAGFDLATFSVFLKSFDDNEKKEWLTKNGVIVCDGHTLMVDQGDKFLTIKSFQVMAELKEK